MAQATTPRAEGAAVKARFLRKVLGGTGYIIHETEDHICVGSAYVSELISIRKDTLQLRYALDTFGDGRRAIRHEPLIGIWDKLVHLIATGEIREIIEGKDEIENPLPIFTYDDQYRIVESVTDEYGWPNTDIEGRLMYENTWFATEGEAVAKAIDNCESSINWRKRLLETKRAEIAELEEEIKSAQAAMSRLTIMSKEVQP